MSDNNNIPPKPPEPSEPATRGPASPAYIPPIINPASQNTSSHLLLNLTTPSHLPSIMINPNPVSNPSLAPSNPPPLPDNINIIPPPTTTPAFVPNTTSSTTIQPPDIPLSVQSIPNISQRHLPPPSIQNPIVPNQAVNGQVHLPSNSTTNGTDNVIPVQPLSDSVS